jgi:periplasmic protein TonB
MVMYAPHDSSHLSRRGVAFLGIIVLHAFLIWAFAKGFAVQGVRYVQTILQTNIIQTEKPKDLPPPPPPVDLKERPPVQVIAPDINISVPVDTPPPIQQVTTERVAPAPVPRAIVPGTPLRPTYAPDVSQYYPDSSRRAGEQGRALVKVCVNPQGKLDTADVSTSTGFPALDEAAVKYAKAMRYKAATSEGRPVLSCSNLPVRFELH